MKRVTFDLVQGGGHEPPQSYTRTDYRCAAQGCPNMGGIGGTFGQNRGGACYFHHSADSSKWAEVTRQILSDDKMRDPVYAEPTILPDKAKDGDRAWAWALKAREEAGFSMPPAHKTMWRAALARHLRAEA